MTDLLTWTTATGKKALSVVPTIPDDAPDSIREGIARRRLVATGQPCPCGARPIRPNRHQRRKAAKAHPGTVHHVVVWHESECPASTDALIEAMRQWRDTA